MKNDCEPLSEEESLLQHAYGLLPKILAAQVQTIFDRLQAQLGAVEKLKTDNMRLSASYGELMNENEAVRQRADQLKAMLQRFHDSMLVGPFVAREPTMHEVEAVLEAKP